MSADPIEPTSGGASQRQGADGYEVIHLGEHSAVVVPMADYLELQALRRVATAEALQDAEDLAALTLMREREAAGQTSYQPLAEVRRQLGLDG